jgi:hypothetical protein
VTIPVFGSKKRLSTLVQPPSHLIEKSCGRIGNEKPFAAAGTTGR